MEVIYNAAASLINAAPMYESKSFDTGGIVAAYKRIVERVLPKYEDPSHPGFTAKINSIKAFYNDLQDQKNIDMLAESSKKTLDLIKLNLKSFVEDYVRNASTGVSGGRLNGEVQAMSQDMSQDMFDVYEKPSLAPQSMYSKPVDEYAPVLNDDLTPAQVETPTTLINNDFVEQLGKNHFKLKPSANARRNMEDTANLLRSTIIGSNGSVLPEIETKISNNFVHYYNECLNTFEAIRPSNKIRNASNPDSIRPPVLIVLVKELAKAVNDEDDEAVRKYTYSIIQWYLLHNETKGVDLPSYNNMLNVIKTTDDTYKMFVRDINKQLRNL
jgi:hypothetical protein